MAQLGKKKRLKGGKVPRKRDMAREKKGISGKEPRPREHPEEKDQSDEKKKKKSLTQKKGKGVSGGREAANFGGGPFRGEEPLAVGLTQFKSEAKKIKGKRGVRGGGGIWGGDREAPREKETLAQAGQGKEGKLGRGQKKKGGGFTVEEQGK